MVSLVWKNPVNYCTRAFGCEIWFLRTGIARTQHVHGTRLHEFEFWAAPPGRVRAVGLGTHVHTHGGALWPRGSLAQPDPLPDTFPAQHLVKGLAR